MSILTRRPNQTLCIGDDIRIVVLGFYDDRVRLGIEAPRSIAVDREEIHKRKQAEQVQSGVAVLFPR
jgi:carbon storage regulator